MRSKQRPYYFLAIVVPPLLFALQSAGIAEPLRAGALTLLKPALLAGHAVVRVVDVVGDHWVLFWETFQKRSEDRSRRVELESKLVGLEELARENERLRQLLDFRSALGQKSIAARVVARDSFPWRHTVILDKGTRHGVRKDMAVIVAEGLVGRVLEPGPETARVILLIDPDSRVSALASESRAQGVVAGDGSAALRMLYLEMDGGVAVGEGVLTSGVGSLFPKGILVGKIAALAREDSGLHLMARVEPVVKFSKLEEVLCLESSPAK